MADQPQNVTGFQMAQKIFEPQRVIWMKKFLVFWAFPAGRICRGILSKTKLFTELASPHIIQYVIQGAGLEICEEIDYF